MPPLSAHHRPKDLMQEIHQKMVTIDPCIMDTALMPPTTQQYENAQATRCLSDLPRNTLNTSSNESCYRDDDDYHDDNEIDNFQVVVRIRPLNDAEEGSSPCVDVLVPTNLPEGEVDENVRHSLCIQNQFFSFDRVFEQETSQHTIYSTCVNPLVHCCIEGYNATVLAYGQTGSGKTHTVLGGRDDVSSGFIPRALSELFHRLEEIKVQSSECYDRTFEYEVRVQFFEIYGEEIRDLLAPSKASNDRKSGDNASRNTSQRRKKPKVQVKIRDIGKDELQIMGATEHRILHRDRIAL